MERYEIILRLMLAFVIGGVIGYNRENNHSPAGLRTHILVCVGAACTSLVQLSILEYTAELVKINVDLTNIMKIDLSRLGAQVITGVGFLGAGTIIHEKGLVKGLTTAASVWIVACIGIGIGFGFYFLAISSSIVVYLSLVSLKKAEKKFIEKTKDIKLYIEYVDKYEATRVLEEILREKNAKILSLECNFKEECNKNVECCIYYMMIPVSINNLEFINDLSITGRFKCVKII